MAKALVQVEVEMPDDLLQEFIQYIRNWDSAHEDCHFGMKAYAPGKTLEEMQAIFADIDPPFVYTETFLKQ